MIAADSLWMSPQHERDTVAFHFTWRRDQPAVMQIVNRVERALSDFAPRPHWGKLFTLDASTLAERYPRHADFLDLLERLDPRHAFRSPWVDRVIAG